MSFWVVFFVTVSICCPCMFGSILIMTSLPCQQKVNSGVLPTLGHSSFSSFSLSVSLSLLYLSNSTEEIEFVCSCALVCCMGITKGTLGGQNRKGWTLKQGTKERGYFYSFRVMLRASSTQDLCGCGCFYNAGKGSSMATL